MTQAIAKHVMITAKGRYRVTAERSARTDILSIYVNRVRKTVSEDADSIVNEFDLKEGDLVESTGILTVELLEGGS